MRVLFVLGNVYPHDDANSMIVMRICKELKRIDSKIEVSILGISDEEGSEILSDIKIHRFVISQLNGLSDNLRDFLTRNISISRKQKIIRLLKNPKLFVEYIQNRIKVNSPSIQYRNAIRSLHHDNSYDAVIGVSFPFTACLGAARTGLNIPFFYYQLDPYFSHYLQPNKRMSLNQERYVCRKANAIILTDLIYKEYMQSPLKKYLKKSIIVGFPAIEQVESTSLSAHKRVNGRIHMLYLGSLYYDIRSPKGFLKLANEMIRNGIDLSVDFVGPVFGTPDEDTISYLHNLGDHVMFHGRVNGQEAKEWFEKTDILINIGNTIKNQMPSKIFEYFSSGKPILNFYKFDQCPALQYTNRYPLCMNIPENFTLSQDFIASVRDFCVSNVGCRIPYNEVENIFSDFTVREVGRRFHDYLSYRSST